MILDASVAIALRSPQDAHAAEAVRLVLKADDLVVHPVTLAETLVAPARAGIAAQVRQELLEGLGIRLWHPQMEEPERVATLRAETRAALPDCYPLALAEHLRMPLATFDEPLRNAARSRGIAIA